MQNWLRLVLFTGLVAVLGVSITHPWVAGLFLPWWMLNRYWSAKYVWLTQPNSLVTVTVSGAEAELVFADQRRIQARLVQEVLILPWLMTLTFKTEDRTTVQLVLWPDSADADRLRHLRVHLRTHSFTSKQQLKG